MGVIELLIMLEEDYLSYVLSFLQKTITITLNSQHIIIKKHISYNKKILILSSKKYVL